MFDANGDLEEGINFAVNFTEGVDTGIPIISPRAFFRDNDINPSIEEVNVTLNNAQFNSTLEFLTVTQVPPLGLTITSSPHSIQIRGSFSPSSTEYVTALLSIEYRNLAEEPESVPRTISFSVSDGKNLNSPQTIVTINVITFDDVPIVDLNGGENGLDNTVSYTEGSGPTLLSEDLTIIDPDSPNLVSATVSISTVFDAGNESISIDTNTLGSISCVPASCSGQTLQLTGTATQSDYQTVLRTLQYVNLKQPEAFPSLFDRIVNVRVNDGNSDSSSMRHILVDVNPINERIILELDAPNVNYFINYTENSGTQVPVVGNTRLVDFSLTSLERVIVNIRNPLLEVGERLLVTCMEDGISTEINNAVKQITFSQNVAVQKFQNALACLRYENTEDEPQAVVRYVDFLIVPGGGAPNNTVSTTIEIIHFNDNPPQCNLGVTGGNVSLSESVVIGSEIHTLQATDIDLGNQDGMVTYRLVSGNETGHFAISVENQVLTIFLVSEVDFEGVKSYPLVIESCDQGTPVLCCNFTFSFVVTDANDNPPMFSQPTYLTSVDENVEQQLLTFAIDDLDSGVNADVVMLEVASVSPMSGCMGKFSTSLSPLALYTTNGGLDYEQTTNCTVVVRATDGGVPANTGSAVVTVLINNVDDRPPVFTGPPGLLFEVEEDNKANLDLGMVTASDPDSDNGALVFSLPGTTAAMFIITPNTGSLLITFSTNYSVNTEFTFPVRVTDPADNLADDTITVRVIPINNEAPILDLNSTTPEPDNSNIAVVFVEESTEPVTLNTSPLITDPDPVNLTITMVVAEIANGEDAAMERLVINNSTAPSYTQLSPTNEFELRVQPSNPGDLQEVYNLIQSIQYINSEDELSPCRADRHPCALGPNSRTILIDVFDGLFFSTERKAYVTFQAVNDRPEIDLDTTAAARQLVFRESGPPSPIALTGLFSVSDDDNAYLQSLVCNLTNPQDAGESLLVTSVPPSLLTLTGNETSLLSFTGNATVAQYITALGSVHYYSTSTDPTTDTDRVVTCVVNDGDLDSLPAVATIQFEELNNLPRIFLGVPSVNYVEQGPPVSLTSSPSIFDDDDTSLSGLQAMIVGSTGTEHTLAINNNLTNAAGLTVVSTSVSLTITGTALIPTYTSILASFSYQNSLLEFSSVAPILVRFIATDANGNTSLPVDVAVIPTPVDDNAPEFVQNIYTMSVSESATPGTVVGVVRVTDNDLPTPQTPLFRITSASPLFGTSDFTIMNKLGSPLEGEILVNGALDFDNKQENYTINILAESGVFNASAVVLIEVQNENDQPPVFVNPPDSFSVFESDVIGAPLMPNQIRAEDPDDFPLQYSITTGSQFVAIDSDGFLSLSGPVDREGVPGVDFEMTVTVSDGVDTIERNYTVTVMDVNEHPPMFEQDPYFANVTENAPPLAAPLVTVQTVDRDEEADIQMSSAAMTMVTYSLNVGPFSNSFYISSTSGELFQNASIDFESSSTPITLTVVANDNSNPPLSSSAIISIAVINLNDERPLFDPPVPETVIVPENNLIDLVITASDPDPNDELRFSLNSGSSSKFMINMMTGRVTQMNMIDVDPVTSVREYPYTVTVRDTNTDPDYLSLESAQSNFTIIVEDVNDNVPMFEQSMYTMTLSENRMEAGIPLITVSAIDRDYGLFSNGSSNGNNRISYSLSGAPDGVFAIDEDTGNITWLVPLDRETQDVYIFQAVARDNPVIGLPNEMSVTVIINVTDVNEHAPIADPDSYTVTIPEDVSINTVLRTNVAVQWSFGCKCIIHPK